MWKALADRKWEVVGQFDETRYIAGYPKWEKFGLVRLWVADDETVYCHDCDLPLDWIHVGGLYCWSCGFGHHAECMEKTDRRHFCPGCLGDD